MKGKCQQINSLFEHYRFKECLILIEQTMKKFTKDKKKDQLEPIDVKALSTFKTGCLVSLGKFHEASHILDSLMNKESINLMAQRFSLLLCSISELFGDGTETKLLELTEQAKQDKESLFRFYLTSERFKDLSGFFWKEYMASKNVSAFLSHIYLQYLDLLNKNNMIQFRRDGWYRHDQRLKMGLKLINSFLGKCCEQIEQSKIHYQNINENEKLIENQEYKKRVNLVNKLKESSEEFKLRIMINEGRVEDAITQFRLIRPKIRFPFTFIRSILKLRQSTQEVKTVNAFYIETMSQTFRTNLDFSNYTPWYDYYNEFLQLMIEDAQKTNPNIKKDLSLKEQKLSEDKLYIFTPESPQEIIQVYFKSLFTEYISLVDEGNPNYEQNKKSDYFKICIKGLLLQLIYIASFFESQELLQKYLTFYTHTFKNTLTYAHEMKQYWNILIDSKILISPEKVEKQNELIQQINFHKIQIAVTHKQPSFEGFNEIFQRLSLLYHARVKEVQKNRNLQKGQRYLSDQFYTLIADYARAYIETVSHSKQVVQICCKLVDELEKAVAVSPYNADIKLRYMQFCRLLNHTEKMNEVFFTNDIKSVQWESLGYWFIKSAIEFEPNIAYDQQVDKMVKSYQDNRRETSEYSLKALKAGELERVDEYLCYRTCINNSYNKIIILYQLYQKYRLQNQSEYYLIKINEKINAFRSSNCPLTFNADFKVMKNEIFPSKQYGNFYGIFNSFDILEKQVQLTQHEHALSSMIQDKSQENKFTGLIELPKLEENINSFKVENAFDFSRYTFQEGSPKITSENNKYSFFRTGNQLQNFKAISLVRISVVQLVSHFHTFLKTKENKQEITNELTSKVMKCLSSLVETYSNMDYLCQIQGITMIRRGLFESYNLLFMIQQLVSKNKKLKFGKEVIVERTEKLLVEIMNQIVNLKWSAKKEESSSNLVAARDEQVEKQLNMDPIQAKKILSKYQSLYKL